MVTQLSFYLQRGKAAGEVANAGKHKLFERESKTKYILSATLAMTLDFLADYNYQSDKRIAIKQEMKRPCAMAIYAHVHVTEAEKNVTEWNQSTVWGYLEIFRTKIGILALILYLTFLFCHHGCPCQGTVP